MAVAKIAWPALALCAGLGGCASPAAIESYEIERARQWGDRTAAITYRFWGPVIAYYEPGPGNGGRLLVWDEGREELLIGKWYVNSQYGGVCFTPNPYYKEMVFQPPIERESCAKFGENPIQFSHYQGDIFGLRGRTSVPYVSSRADNARIQEVLKRSSEFRRKPFGREEPQPPRNPSATAAPAAGEAPAAAQ